MFRLAAFGLAVVLCVPAAAQQPAQPQRQSVELELLEIEQAVDKELLREALLLQGRTAMKPAPERESAQKAFAEETVLLRDYIARKREAITVRAAELAEKRVASRRGAQPPSTATAGQPAATDARDAIEKYEKVSIEVQLLQAQVGLLEGPLSKAVDVLAKAEVDADNDESLRPKAEEARKAYEKLKARFVDHSKRLRLQQQDMGSMQQTLGVGGFAGAGMR